ncbi:MAG: hypothetical protein HY043_14255 [Verrucomicrobia bacterium]|nr:hypothetical protein [Verrucomicrobiota bacterium]
MKPTKLILAVCLLATAAAIAAPDAVVNSDVITIPREQYLKMLKVIEDHDKLVQEVKEIQAFKARFEESQKTAKSRQTETDQALDELDKHLKDVKQMAKDSFPGSTKTLLTGYGSAGFIAQDRGGTRQFGATFNPIFLWKLSDRLIFEGELEAELEGHDTSLALELAQISYIVNDYMTVGAGKFLNPMNYFVERQHMAWVNKLPDKPLAVYDGLLAETEVGFQLRGGVPVGSTKFGYSLYVANAPELRFDASNVGASDLGTLEFNNFDNVGRHVAVGGHIGFLPIPEFEVGYGFQVSEVTPPGASESVNSLLHSADLSYVRDSARLQGTLNLKAQWIWSHVDGYTYDPDSAAGGPFAFNNNRNGGYAQIAYRPSKLENACLKNLEPVFRYDLLKQARTPTGTDEHRYTIGLNYWLGPTTVAKVAYEFDHQNGPNADRHNAVLLQLATGF